MRLKVTGVAALLAGAGAAVAQSELIQRTTRAGLPVKVRNHPRFGGRTHRVDAYSAQVTVQ